MFEVSFSHASRLNSFFLLASALLRLVQWFVEALYRVRFVLSFCLFVCLFFFWWAWLSGGNPVFWWLGLYFCLLFRWGILHRVLLVFGWCQVLYSSGFLCVNSHSLIIPRVTSLVPHWLRAGPVLLTLLFFPPSSFILPSFAWFYISFSTGQVLLSALSWCSSCISVSKGVFLMYLWREMYSMSTSSSAILFLSLFSCF